MIFYLPRFFAPCAVFYHSARYAAPRDARCHRAAACRGVCALLDGTSLATMRARMIDAAPPRVREKRGAALRVRACAYRHHDMRIDYDTSSRLLRMPYDYDYYCCYGHFDGRRYYLFRYYRCHISADIRRYY